MNGKEPEADSRNNLGDVIHKLNSSAHVAEEKKRIHLLLLDEESQTSIRTKKWCLSSKKFEKKTLGLAKTLHGFRPRTAIYKSKAYEYIIGRMGCDPLFPGWGDYECAYIDYLRESRKELTQLLDSEVGNDEADSATLIKTVIDKAQKYNVSAEDISELYENWYFERNEEFSKWIQGLEERSRGIENERHFNKVESDLDDMKRELSLINKALKNNIDEKAFKSLCAQLEDIQARYADEFKGLQREFSKVNKQTVDLSANVTKLQCTEKKLATNQNGLKYDLSKLSLSYQDYINEKVSVLINEHKKSISDLVATLNQESAELETRQGKTAEKKQERAYFKERNKVVRRVGTGLAETRADEQQFIATYQQSLEFSCIEMTAKASIANHCILKNSDVICCQSISIFDAWIRALNWEQYVLEAVADPNWTNYAAWHDVVSDFLTDSSIRFLVLHSYNTGYVEGYLKPFLILFRREQHAHKKIILVETKKSLVNSLPGMGLGLIEGYKIDRFKDPLATFKKTGPVALGHFDEWLIGKSEESEDHARDICQDLMRFSTGENIDLPAEELKEIYLVLCAYFDSGLALNKKIKLLLFTTLLSNLWSEESINKFIEST